ncbi:hypothetical protein J5N97_015282 [Dioscorea zingiberensis]|uniref:Uncharacterized protein n=1 Tax=Dioscorea zingiberensis TaxID=325984 RepID=A0A9D5CWR6_9LILI|nr:hypothetical protein J5N97_015282 [Dioscorea zingiberensis]
MYNSGKSKRSPPPADAAPTDKLTPPLLWLKRSCKSFHTSAADSMESVVASNNFRGPISYERREVEGLLSLPLLPPPPPPQQEKQQQKKTPQSHAVNLHFNQSWNFTVIVNYPDVHPIVQHNTTRTANEAHKDSGDLDLSLHL